MMTFEHTIRMLAAPILEDGVISLGETSLLLRAVQPFAIRGNAEACELRDMLLRVRRDGVVTKEESLHISRLIEQITKGTIRLEQYTFMVPDFPSRGSTFCDTSRFLDTPWLLQMVLDVIDEILSGVEFDMVVSPEPRGVAFGAAIAARRKCGFAPVCEKGRLPREALTESCGGANGPRELQMHEDAVMRGERVLVVDDVVATGETAAAVAKLVTRAGGKVVKMVFPVEVESCGARGGALQGFDVASLVKLKAR